MSTTRRTILRGIAATPAALALPVTALAAPVAADPALAELAARYAAAHRRWVAALAENAESETRIVYPDPPEALYGRPDEPIPFGSAFIRYLGDRRWFGDKDVIEQLKKLGPSHPAWSHPGAFDRRAELIDAYDDWERAIRAAQDTAGFTATDAEFVEADDERRAIHARIIRLRSTDPAVRRLKLQVLADYMEEPRYLDNAIEVELTRGGAVETALALSIARDLCSFDQLSA